MWPWGHLALGYLLYAGYRGLLLRRSPAGLPVIALAVGTQFPDLVDKPLDYWFGILPAGRSLAHSALVFVPIALLLLALAWNYRRTELGVAFVIGWGSHLIGDSFLAIRQGAYGQLSFLLWPVRPAPEYATHSFLPHLRKLLAELGELTIDGLLSPGQDPFVLEIWLAAFVLLLWIVQGMPPLRWVGRWVAWVLDGRPSSR